MTDTGFDQIFPTGQPNEALGQYFIGQSYLAPLTDGSMPVNNVTFEPGCRNNWQDRKSTRLNSSHSGESRMPSSA